MSSGWGVSTIVSSGAPGQQDTRMFMQEVTLNSTNLSNRSVTLRYPTISAPETSMTVLDGGDQTYGVDYTVTSDGNGNNVLTWSGFALDGILAVGDILQITYPILAAPGV